MNGITETEYNSGTAVKGIVKNLNVAKNCGNNWGNCFSEGGTYLGLTGASGTSLGGAFAKVLLSDGTIIALSLYKSDNCSRNIGSGPLNNSVCGTFYIDVNGLRGPDIIGKDLFLFWVTSSGQIIPGGSSFDAKCPESTRCNPNDTTTSENGSGCTAKVIKEGKIDY